MEFLDMRLHIFDAGIIEEKGFGKLKFEQSFWYLILTRQLSKRLQAVVLLKTLPGEIDRYREQLISGLLPTPDIK